MICSGSHHSPACWIPSTSSPASVMRSASCSMGMLRSTYSFNHETGTNIVFYLQYISLSNSLEEPHIIGEEVTDVVDAVLLHRNAVRAHAEGEATELGWIIA